MYFDQKTKWIEHLKYLKISTNSLNIMKRLSHKTWGGDEQTLTKIHRHHMRSKLDYGATIYKSANHTHLKIIETTANTSIRLAIGAFRSSPIECMRNLAMEIPPELRRTEQSLIYAANISINTQNPANKHIERSIEEAEKLQINLH